VPSLKFLTLAAAISGFSSFSNLPTLSVANHALVSYLLVFLVFLVAPARLLWLIVALTHPCR
jgi:hypothetical protein